MAAEDTSGAALTVGQLIEHIAPSYAREKNAPDWPPDAFAVAATVLQRSGGYRRVVETWPPEPPGDETWTEWVAGLGRRWRDANNKAEKPPREVQRWWRKLQAAHATPIAEVARKGALCDALVQLCAASDTACEGVGVPLFDEQSQDGLWWTATTRLSRTSLPGHSGGATMCTERVLPWAARVLPKLHTPQTGITIRSLSHHLALSAAEEVVPRWIMPLGSTDRQDPQMLNLLIVPWPTVIDRNQFVPVKARPKTLANMPDSFGFFRFKKRPRPAGIKKELDRIYRAAKSEAGTVDAVVLPELALTDSEFKAVQSWAYDEKVLLISGVGRVPAAGEPEENLVSIALPFGIHKTAIEQSKHHRWRLTRSQIEAYGLAGHLNPALHWWEYTQLGDRSLYFASLLPWLTLCVLVCEDLAQQEPVARVVRAVGPNLVIAVLMDGPQLGARWPGRYATVLADDPGSSVLTLTSLGMCERSVPPGKSPSRVVALWKDSKGQRELTLSPGADALLLNLLIEQREEWTADGRSDKGAAGLPVLVGAYDIEA